MQIHDRKDQLIYVLGAIQATVWVGLFSVGFWNGNDVWVKLFWISMVFVTLSMFGQTFSVLACYYYPKAVEDSLLGVTTNSRKEKIWRKAWNAHWCWFGSGLLTSALATVFRFLGWSS